MYLYMYNLYTCYVQTTAKFREKYNQIYNISGDEDGQSNDEDLVIRSFTDDPEIPLQQIMVRQHTYIHVHTVLYNNIIIIQCTCTFCVVNSTGKGYSYHPGLHV